MNTVYSAHADAVSSLTVKLQPANSAPVIAASIERAVTGGHVRSFQMLDDKIALAFVAIEIPRWSGLFLVDLQTRKISDVITPLGEVSDSGRDSSGNTWTIVKGEYDAPGRFRQRG